jgi:mannose-6-phosphate isomerase-like protein (cupin superfamily)
LLRLALVFSVGLEFFFKEDEGRSLFGIVRRENRQRFPDNPEEGHISYYFESLDYEALDRKMDAFLAHFEPPPDDGKLPLHEHEGAEFIYVISGSLELRHDGNLHHISAGDSVYFNSSIPHGYCRHGQEHCSAVVITVPAAQR